MAGRTTGVNNERGTCTQLKHFALPQWNNGVVNLTGLVENKGLEAQYGRRCLLVVNGKEQGIAVVCIIRVKKGPGSTVH